MIVAICLSLIVFFISTLLLLHELEASSFEKEFYEIERDLENLDF
jgi:hypothetical protein